MSKQEFTEKKAVLEAQLEAVKKEYLVTNQPIMPFKLVTIYRCGRFFLTGMIMGYKIVNNSIYYEIAPLRKNGFPHKSQRHCYDIEDETFKVVQGVKV